MLKILLLCLLLFVYDGGCKMAENSQNTTAAVGDGVRELIIKDIESSYSLKSTDIDLKELKTNNIPQGSRVFYAEKKNSYGNIFYNYIFFNSKIYSSGREGDFGKFLADINFLQEKKLNAEQFWNAFRLLRFTYREALLIDAKAMAAPSDSLKKVLNQVMEPKLEFTGGGAQFTFFIRDTNLGEYRKYVVNIDDKYQVQINHSQLTNN